MYSLDPAYLKNIQCVSHHLVQVISSKIVRGYGFFKYYCCLETIREGRYLIALAAFILVLYFHYYCEIVQSSEDFAHHSTLSSNSALVNITKDVYLMS